MNKNMLLIESTSNSGIAYEINALDPKDWVISGNVAIMNMGASVPIFVYLATMVRPEGYVTQEQRDELKEQEERLKELYDNMEDALTTLELATEADRIEAYKNADNAHTAIKSYKKSIGQILI